MFFSCAFRSFWSSFWVLKVILAMQLVKFSNQILTKLVSIKLLHALDFSRLHCGAGTLEDRCIKGPHWYCGFFFPSHLFALLFSLPPSRDSDPGSRRSRLFSPLSARLVPFISIAREKSFSLSSLVDSRLFVLTHARRSQQLILFIFANGGDRVSSYLCVI